MAVKDKLTYIEYDNDLYGFECEGLTSEQALVIGTEMLKMQCAGRPMDEIGSMSQSLIEAVRLLNQATPAEREQLQREVSAMMTPEQKAKGEKLIKEFRSIVVDPTTLRRPPEA